MTIPRGKLILLEGGEGVGKSTQAKLLINRLKEFQISAELIREPGGDPIAESIRSLILDDATKGIEPLAELFLFSAARAQVMKTKVAPKLDAGVWVIADRGLVSSVVYQGYVKGVSIADVRTACQIAVGKCLPDKIVLLHAPAKVALARRAEGGGSNRFEAEGLAFHHKVNQAYLKEARQAGHAVVDAIGKVETVSARIWQHVQPILPAV